MKFWLLNLTIVGVFLAQGNALIGLRSELNERPVPADQPFEELEEVAERDLEDVESPFAGGLADSLTALFPVVVTRLTEQTTPTLAKVLSGPHRPRAPPLG